MKPGWQSDAEDTRFLFQIALSENIQASYIG